MAHILILEPDIRLARTYGQLFAAHGHTVESCTTAQDAVIAADEQTPDLVIVELQLVSHSGIEFLYEFRSYADWKHVPVLVLSTVPAEEFADSQDLLRRLGVREFHYKPRTSLQQLLRNVQAILQDPSGHDGHPS